MEPVAVRSIKGRCKGCYVCIRSCPVKAIKVKEGQASILGERCISCGLCTIVCHQRVKRVKESKEAVLSLIDRGEHVVAILDPSFVGSFYPYHPLEIVSGLKEVGFKEVWDGGIGAEMISNEYKRLLKDNRKTIISSHCHAIVNLIEKHYPELIPNLAQVVSPMIGIARFILRNSVENPRIVYIGPCVAKKNEIKDEKVKGVVDEVLTFKEMKEIFKKRKASLKERAEFDGPISGIGRLLAMAGGISRSIWIPQGIFEDTILITGGIQRCKDALDGLRKGMVNFRFLDLMLCQAGCIIDGPGIHTTLNPFTRRQILLQFAKSGDGGFDLTKIKEGLPDLSRTFTNRILPLSKPTSSQIREILAKTEKYKDRDELNCGACGYQTCKEKAVAVFQGLAEVDMCLPYLISKVKKTKERELHAIIEQTEDGIIVMDKEMRITLFNKAAERITGYPRMEAIGRLCREVFHGNRCDTQNCPYIIALKTGKGLLNLESSILTRNGERIPIRFSTSLLRDEDGRIMGAVKVFQDISKLKEIDQMKDEFISHVSHEFRTPIASIKGAVDLLLAGTEGELTQDQKGFLEIVRNNIERLTRLVTDLLDLSKIEAGRFELRLRHLSIKALVDDVLKHIGILAKDKGLTVDVNIPDELPMVPMDGDRIRQVLTNLLSNAIKYTSKGGIYIWCEEREDELVTSIRDTGIGIPPSKFKQIFEKFRPIDPNHPGGRSVGLGLPICKGIIEAHKGRIWVESEPGKGSIFSFALPKEKRKGEKMEFHLPIKKRPFEVKRVLVVDDDVEMADLFTRFLETEGYEVDVAYDGEQAISKARSFNPDIITLDILMPEKDGFEVLERLKEDEATCDIPVIIISVVKDPDQTRLMRLGIARYLHKPLDREELVRQIKEIEDWINRKKAKKMILIVEDEMDQLRIMKEVLSGAGYTLVEAHSGEEALALTNHYHPDLILLDLGLPGMDGIEVIKRLKHNRSTSSIPVIVLTIRDIESEKTMALDLGASEYMIKPFSQEEFLSKIHERMKKELI